MASLIPNIPASVVYTVYDLFIFIHSDLHNLSVVYFDISGSAVSHLQFSTGRILYLDTYRGAVLLWYNRFFLSVKIEGSIEKSMNNK